MDIRFFPTFNHKPLVSGSALRHSEAAAAAIIDRLIVERAPRLTGHPLWPLFRPAFYATLNYRRAVVMAHEIACLPGRAALERVSDRLKLNLHARGIENIPKSGGCLIVANHPSGIADGIALFDLVRRRRNDVAIFANRDALEVNPRFPDILIPVEWREEAKTRAKSRQALELTSAAFRSGKAVILFPSGRIAYMDGQRLTDRPWRSSAVALARKYGVPIIPVHIELRNSPLFYLLSRWSTELRDMTVFHEFLNKTEKPVKVICGRPVSPDLLIGDAVATTRRLQFHCEHGLAANQNAQFGG